MYDLVIKNGLVIDTAQRIHNKRDIGITNGRIAAFDDNIAPSQAKKVIDAKSKIVTAGLIDIHTHVAHIITRLGAPPDEVGVRSGVTTVVDSGSTGYANFLGFRRFIIPQAKTDIFSFLHVCPSGQAVQPDTSGWSDVNPEITLELVENHKDVIKGIKMRAIRGVMVNHGVKAIKIAKKIATEAKLPLMVHIGIGDVELGERTPDNVVNVFTRELLSRLDKGDIVTHMYTWKPGGIIKTNGTVVPEIWGAIKRGVILDVGHEVLQFSFEVAKIGLEKGILPTTLSTDCNIKNGINSPAVLSLAVTMSKFLALGLSLDQVIEMTTINPALALGEEKKRGSLRTGMLADISIMELTEGDFTFYDRNEKSTPLKGRYLLVPKLSIKSGVEISAVSRYQ